MKKKCKAFTLLEMLVVLFVISMLLLLFVPQVMKQRETAQKESEAAIVKVVETQIEVYKLEHDGKEPSESELVDEYVTKEQYEIYKKRPNK